MKETRPDPEKLLKRIQEEEQKSQTGKLKIYLGAAPGVGKTHSMLEDAFDKRAQGIDIVVGIVETHSRREIEFLLADFEIIPRQTVEYHGQKLQEFDIDAVLKRRPTIVLIDEMAHTNLPGLRHKKRWQDIKEILDRGIDVHTTLNVQHIESLNDVVSQIIHTRVKETVPDFMIEQAANIELVDLPPEDLIKRLNEGKVYFPTQAEIAKDHFFLKGNLTALRELALRVTAERVSKQVLSYREGLGIKYIWPTKERLLVCIGPQPSSAKLIRVARRLANRLGAEWLAVHVETTYPKPSEEARNSAIENLRLAEKLGAQTRILTGSNIVEPIITFAHEQNVTEIVVWKPVRSRWRDLFWPSIADDILRKSGEIDVYVVTSEHTEIKNKPINAPTERFLLKPYFYSSLLLIFITSISSFLFPYLSSTNILLLYLLGTIGVALTGYVFPALFTAISSTLLFNFFFIFPYYSLTLNNIQYLLSAIVTIIAAATISRLSFTNKRQAKLARQRDKYSASLQTLNHLLASTRGTDKLLENAVGYVAEVFNSTVMALLPTNNKLIIRAKRDPETRLSEKEEGVAIWVYDMGQVAGLGTDTLPFSEAIYLPLLATQGTIGVLRIRPAKKDLFTPEELYLLEACAHQIAIAIEVDRLHEQEQQSELLSKNERIRNKLLQSVSHSLRTPLVAVKGAATTLIEMGNQLDRSKVKALANTIFVELQQLDQLINNLLQITYLEAETIKLQKQYYPLYEIIDAVVKSLTSKLAQHHIKVNIPPDLPLIPADKSLIEEVLVNLIQNAIIYSPSDTTIDITAFAEPDRIIIGVEDRGPGIATDEVNLLFEKFYRGRKLTTIRGLGLGLPISRHIVNAHGGVIWAENRKDGGAAFYFSLPLSM